MSGHESSNKLYVRRDENVEPLSGDICFHLNADEQGCVSFESAEFNLFNQEVALSGHQIEIRFKGEGKKSCEYQVPHI